MKFAIIDDLISDSIMCYKALMAASKEHFKDVVIDSYSSFEEYKHSKEKYYAIFLDVDLGTKMNGIEVFQQIDKDVKVIFVSCYDHYVFQAVHLIPYDYIRKEVFPVEIHGVLAKLKNDYYFENHKVAFPRIGMFPVNNILYFEARGNKERCVTYNDEIIMRIPQKRLLEMLTFNGYCPFVKVNRSLIINCKNIAQVEASMVRMKNGETFQYSEYVKGTIYAEILKKRF